MRTPHVLITALLVVPLATATTVGVARLVQRAPDPPLPTDVGRAAVVSSPKDDACLRRREALTALPALPGALEVEAVRAEIMARAKAEPVLFTSKPVVSAPESLSVLRERLHHGGVPWQVLNDVFSQLKRYPKRLRQVLLTDGYLYAERPDLAALLASGISLNQLFTEQELELTRGDTTRLVVRKRDDYVWADGPEVGQPARLWLFDRVNVKGEPVTPPKHISLGRLRAEIGAARIEIEHVTSSGAVASLHFGEQLAAPAVLVVKNGRFELECEIVGDGVRSAIEDARRIVKRRERVLARLRSAVLEQIDEALPFDEPKTEEGQQDGKLRQEWRTAYLQGRSSFTFNGDEYPVFGPKGIPRIPQVCVDFITDSWERMADTRWQRRNETRARRVGRLDFDALGITNRRSVENLIDFAVARPQWFEPLLIPESERIAFADRSAFFRRLYDMRSDFQVGDVVAILGPRDDDKLHYHSFFIIESDPLTQMPTLLAANAGKPRIRTWEGEMQNAPRRSIMARIRPKLEWLEAIAGFPSTAAAGG